MSSIRAEAEQEIRRAAEEDRARDEYNEREARRLVESWFYRDFYEHHLIPNPDYTSRSYAPKSNPRRIVDPARPLPPMEAFDLTYPGVHADAEFVCEGIRYRVKWKYHPGGDRAYWDDGWWPQWFVVVRVPRLFGLLGYREVEEGVSHPADVVETLASYGYAVPEPATRGGT